MTEKSIEDDIREAMAGIQTDTDTEPAADIVEQTDNRERDEHGRFKPRAEEQQDIADEPTEVAADIPETVIDEPIIPDPFGVPPNFAKKAIKESWTNLSPEVRQELYEREKEIHQQFTRYDEERVFGKKAKEVIAPFEGFIRSLGAEPIQAIDYLVKTDYALRTAAPEQRKAMFLKAARDYGIDLGEGPLYTEQQQSVSDPRIDTLQQQLARLENERQNAIREQQEREQHELDRQIEAFAAKPENVYFQRVAPIMGVLLQNGQAESLEKAYDMAVHADPELRALQLAAVQQAEERKRSEQAAAKAKAARSASVSVTGAPGSAVPPQPPGTSTGTVEDDIRAAIAEVSGRI